MSLHDGHRKRLDKKVNIFGLDMLEDHEALEHILFAVIPRGNTNNIAKRLIERFGTIMGVLNAPESELVKVEGVGSRTAKFLNELLPLLGIVERSVKKAVPPKLSNPRELYEFAKSYFYGSLMEVAYVFTMNSSYRLTGMVKLRDGIGGEVVIHPSKVVKVALLNEASAVAVVHNHPCGTLNPSVGDIETTKKIMKACKAAEIELVDSIIISNQGYFSIKEKGYLDEFWENYK